MTRSLAIVLGLSIAAANCGTRHTAADSHTNDVTAPVRGTGGNQLVWYDNGVIVLGNCGQTAIPTRQTCTRAAAAPFDSFAAGIDQIYSADATQKERAYDTEVKRMKDAVPEIVALRTELGTLNQELSDLRAQLAPIARAIAEKKVQAGTIAQTLTTYDAQIATAKDRLAIEPTNPDLKALLTRMEEERAATVIRKQEIDQQIAAAQLSMGELKTKIDEKSRTVDLKTTALADLYAKTEVTSPELNGLKAVWEAAKILKARVPKVLNYIRDGALTYRYDLLDGKDQLIMDRVTKFFEERDGLIKLQGAFQPTLIRHNGEWRAICDDAFTKTDADVLCRSLGLRTKAFRTDIFTNGRYWLSNIRCQGNEQTLEMCPANPWGQHHCDANEGVSVECE